jgi:quercetin dioxygenase-like cupin family protein
MHYLHSTTPSLTTTSNAGLTHHLSVLSSKSLSSYPLAGGRAYIVLEFALNASGEEGFLHRTKTVEYVLMIDGELELGLDGSEKRVVGKGEFLVQRASMHS